MGASAAITPESVYRVNVFAEQSGGCYTCRHFGERVEPAVWCARPGGEHVRSQASEVVHSGNENRALMTSSAKKGVV
jgi:hypothetical protein